MSDELHEARAAVDALEALLGEAQGVAAAEAAAGGAREGRVLQVRAPRVPACVFVCV